MIKITANQLKSKLEQSNNWRFYLAVGSDPYLQQLVQSQIQTKHRQMGFDEQTIFTIDNQTDWNLILDATQSMSLFSNQILIVLQFGETTLSATIAKKLEQLTSQLSSDVNFLISLAKMTKTQENATWVKQLSENLVIVSCNTPELTQLPSWVNQQLEQLDLQIEKQGIDLLCYYYEGNLLALAQSLERLKLLYPSGKISYAQLEENINDAAVFTPYHWIDAMLMGKTKRATHILQQLKMNGTEPLILLRVIQRELILLINLKKHSENQPLKVAYDAYKVWQNRRNLITPYLNRTSLKQLYQSLSKLTELEVMLKNDYSSPVWEHILSFNLLFIGSK